MKTLKTTFLTALITTLLTLSFSSRAEFYDLYPGMLTLQDGQLVLTKCAIVSADFALDFANEELKEQMLELADNDLVQVHVRGEAGQKDDGSYFLIVHDIANVIIGSSCQLLDYIDEHA